jgi:sec-independent protein translocase protein TatA
MIDNMLLLGFGQLEILICALVFLLLFGGAKLPSLMRNLGRSVNEFKTGIKESPTDSKLDDASDAKLEDSKSPVDANA